VHTEHSESPLAENPVSAYSGHWQGESETAAPMEASTQEAVAEPPATEAAPPIVEEAHTRTEPEVQHAPEPAPAQEEAAHVTESAPEPVPSAEATMQPAQPNMDELVARVLGKMNPEVLQRVTQEILKPVIEAIVRDELNSKKP